MEDSEYSPKSRLVALLFCFFLGTFGIHRFYVGKIGTGIFMFVTLGGLGIWVIIDLILNHCRVIPGQTGEKGLFVVRTGILLTFPFFILPMAVSSKDNSFIAEH